MRKIELPYGNSNRTIEVPENNLLWVKAPKDTSSTKDLKSTIKRAISNPIGCLDLEELIKKTGKKVLLLLDDNTRSTPQKEILPILLNELNRAGVTDNNIKGLIALGTHRPMSLQECEERFGKDVMGRISIENMAMQDSNFKNIGTTPLGIPIYVNKQYLDCDISIAVGNIIPHMYAGWAGGAKMVQPGVTNHITTGETHLMASRKVYDILGNIENPVRKEMEEIALKTGLKFIVNVVLNRNGKVVDVVAGDVIQAHRKGVEIARKIYEIHIDDKLDIIIASSHPTDRDLWQGFKPVNNCGMLVKDGGTLILFIPAPEGIAPDHPYLIELGKMKGDTVWQMVNENKIEDRVAAATYMAFEQTRKRINIQLVTDGITDYEAQKIGISASDSFEEVFPMVLKKYNRNAKIGVITHGADILGLIKNR